MRKRQKSTDHKKRQTSVTNGSFSRSLFLSVIGILVCMICLVSTTWAWVSDGIKSSGSVVKTANYDIEIVVRDESGNEVTGQGKNYQLTGNTEYMVTLRAVGTATTGYCVVKADEVTYHIVQIAPGDELSFHFIPAKDGMVSFAAQWGTYSGTPEIEQNVMIGNPASSSEVDDESDAVQDQEEEKEEDSVSGEQEEPSADTGFGGELSETPGETDATENQPQQTPIPPESDSGTGQQEQPPEPSENPTGETSGGTGGESAGDQTTNQTANQTINQITNQTTNQTGESN